MKNLNFGLAILCVIISASSSAMADNLGEHVGKTFADAFDDTGPKILGVGAVLTALSFSQDQPMHDTWVGNQRMPPSVSSVGDFWGHGFVQGGIIIGQFIWDRPNAWPSLEGTLSSTAVTYAMKYSVQRQRPDNGNHDSFPSVHTQISFASATALHMAYGWKVAAPAYIMGVFTGLSRLADDAHWFSDVVAGATIGVLFGRSGFKHHVQVQPMSFRQGDPGFGLTASWRF